MRDVAMELLWVLQFTEKIGLNNGRIFCIICRDALRLFLFVFLQEIFKGFFDKNIKGNIFIDCDMLQFLNNIDIYSRAKLLSLHF